MGKRKIVLPKKGGTLACALFAWVFLAGQVHGHPFLTGEALLDVREDSVTVVLKVTLIQICIVEGTMAGESGIYPAKGQRERAGGLGLRSRAPHHRVLRERRMRQAVVGEFGPQKLVVGHGEEFTIA